MEDYFREKMTLCQLVQMFPPKMEKRNLFRLQYYISLMRLNYASTASKTWHWEGEKSDYPPAARKRSFYSNLVIAVHVKAFSDFRR